MGRTSWSAPARPAPATSKSNPGEISGKPYSRYSTETGDTLKPVSSSKVKNVTLSLPESLVRRFRVYAARQNQSMTSLMAEAIRRMMDESANGGKAKSRFLERIRNAPDRGTGGVIRWTRDELHER